MLVREKITALEKSAQALDAAFAARALIAAARKAAETGNSREAKTLTRYAASLWSPPNDGGRGKA
jgi:hypothetical protein